ncbi:MAG: hypothetical protein ACOC6N_03305, partial [archaeon]
MFNGEKAFKHIEKLAVDIGPRPGGTERDREAVNYIQSYFELLGLDVSTQDFEINTGHTVNQSLEIVEPYNVTIPCEGMSLIGETGPKGITGEI